MVIHSILLNAPIQAKLLDLCAYIEFKIPLSSFWLTRQNRNLKFNVHKSSSLACVGALSSILWITIPITFCLCRLFPQSHLRSLFYLFKFTTFAPLSFRLFFMSMHMDRCTWSYRIAPNFCSIKILLFEQSKIFVKIIFIKIS